MSTRTPTWDISRALSCERKVGFYPAQAKKPKPRDSQGSLSVTLPAGAPRRFWFHRLLEMPAGQHPGLLLATQCQSPSRGQTPKETMQARCFNKLSSGGQRLMRISDGGLCAQGCLVLLRAGCHQH